MCGIAGFVGRPIGADARSVLSRMAARLAHRGPDDEGVWCHDEYAVGLAHRRLSILDLSPEGHQPMVSSSKRYVIAFNGEIYNFDTIRAELSSLGVTFRGRSDTEVFLAAVETWGLQEALLRSVGMFAIALFDVSTRVLYLVRDRLGKKPLYFGRTRSGIAFASELKGLRAHPDFDVLIDRGALAAFFRHNYVPAPHSIYEGVQKVPAGSLISISLRSGRAETTHTCYWSARAAFQLARTKTRANSGDSIERLEVLLEDAVRIRMQADVPLGAFLSGGVDSSLVVALMAKHSALPIRTFTMGFQEADFNEAVHAKAVAAHLGTDHTEFYVTADEARVVIPRLPEIYDEPFADSSQIPTLLVSQLARTQVTVALSGDGGDEFFLGYSRYPAADSAWRRIRWSPSLLRQWAARRIRSTSTAALERWLSWIEPILPEFGRGRTFAETMLKMSEVLGYADEREFYRAFVSHSKQPEALVLGAKEKDSVLSTSSNWPCGADFPTAMAFMDAIGYLPDDVLVKVDRASMAVGLEVRAPLLDHRVAEFAWGLPRHHKLANGAGKIALKQVLYKYVPPRLIDRPKVGFGVPIKEWLRGPLREWVEDTLADERIQRDGFLEPRIVRRFVQEHMSGTRDWHARLWDLLMFCGWLDAQKQRC